MDIDWERYLGLRCRDYLTGNGENGSPEENRKGGGEVITQERCPRCGRPSPPTIAPGSGWMYMYRENYDLGGQRYSIERHICFECVVEGAFHENPELWWF